MILHITCSFALDMDFADNEIWYRLGDISVCVPAKCGSTSFEKTVGRQKRFGRPGPGLRYLAIRHPVDRFISWWRFCQDPNWKYATPGDIRDLGLHDCTTDHLMDVIERFPMRNRHWIPQAYYYGAGVRCVPFERILEHLGYEHRHDNASAAPRPHSVPVERIEKHYAADLALWQECHSN